MVLKQSYAVEGSNRTGLINFSNNILFAVYAKILDLDRDYRIMVIAKKVILSEEEL